MSEKKQLNVLFFKGNTYRIERLQKLRGPKIEVTIGDIDREVNKTSPVGLGGPCVDIDGRLQAASLEQMHENNPVLMRCKNEYQSQLTDPIIVIKHEGRMLLLSGHEACRLAATNPLKAGTISCTLITTVMLKQIRELSEEEKTTIAQAISPIPKATYASNFANSPRFISKSSVR